MCIFHQQKFLSEELYNIPVVSSRFGGYYSDSVILDDLLHVLGMNLISHNVALEVELIQCNDHSQDASVDACMRLSVTTECFTSQIN